ncbi:MAG: hypothetical protein ABJB33_01805 [Gemmatimonadota bacterium]
MQARPILAAAALVAGATAFAAPRSPTTTFRYKVNATNHQVIDLSAVGQPEQVTHLVTTTFVTVVSTDSAGGRAVKVIIDSARADTVQSPQPLSPATFDSLRGATATGWVAPNGQIRDVKWTDPRSAPISGVLRALFPRMDPRAKVGDRWTDTTESAGESEGMPPGTSMRRVTNWSVTGEQNVNGVKARRVESAYSQSISGEIPAGGGTMAIDGTGSGTATTLVAPDGRQLGSNSTLTMTLSLTVPQVPEPLPLNLTTTVVVNPIR